MKHLCTEHLELLDRLLQEAELEVGAAEQAAIAAYLDGIIDANLTMNLTRISLPDDGIRLHLVDSLLALSDVDAAPPGALLDIGTGGGFPGVPLCIATRRTGKLLDSVGKKARAVNAVLESLGLGQAIAAEHDRAEDHARRHAGQYSVVTARAVAELPVLVELASPLLTEGGLLVAWKGAPDESELARGRRVAELAGMREILVRRAELPGGGERRCLVVYERSGAARTRLPRRPGEAQKSPLD